YNTVAILAIIEHKRMVMSQDFIIAPVDKFRVIPLVLDLDKFLSDRDAKRVAFRSAYGLADDEVVLTITGRLVPVKNHELFLTGIHYLIQNCRQKIRAFVVGDGETRLALEEKARQLGIGFNTEKDTACDQPLVFTSWRSDIDHI